MGMFFDDIGVNQQHAGVAAKGAKQGWGGSYLMCKHEVITD